jgi:hypothetical protein
MKFNKNFFLALSYDIFNWGLNFAAVAFMWTINHVFTLTIVSLIALRFFADRIHRQYLYDNLQKEREQLLASFDAQNKQMQQFSTIGHENDFINDQIEFPNILTPTQDKKVH